eukprot:2262808-Rhodomonas_salina.1
MELVEEVERGRGKERGAREREDERERARRREEEGERESLRGQDLLLSHRCLAPHVRATQGPVLT